MLTKDSVKRMLCVTVLALSFMTQICVSFLCHAVQEIDEERRDKEYVTYQERMMHNRRRIQVSSVYTMLR